MQKQNQPHMFPTGAPRRVKLSADKNFDSLIDPTAFLQNRGISRTPSSALNRFNTQQDHTPSTSMSMSALNMSNIFMPLNNSNMNRSFTNSESSFVLPAVEGGTGNLKKKTFENVHPLVKKHCNNPGSNFISSILYNLGRFPSNNSLGVAKTLGKWNNSSVTTPAMVTTLSNGNSNTITEEHGPFLKAKGVAAREIPGNTEISNTQLAQFNISKNKNLMQNLRLFTGTAEKVIKWHKIYKNHFCYYEVIASIISIQKGNMQMQKIMLLRDKKGPILQIIHYSHDHIHIENFYIGQMLRCVGRMVGPNVMHGLSIRQASDGEIASLQRMSYISDHAIIKSMEKN